MKNDIPGNKVQKSELMSTMTIYNLIGALGIVSFAAIIAVVKLVFHDTLPDIWVYIFMIWLLILWDSFGLVSVIRKEIPRYPPAKYIKGKGAVILGLMTIIIGVTIQIFVISKLIM
jgi:hypothetical protein